MLLHDPYVDELMLTIINVGGASVPVQTVRRIMSAIVSNPSGMWVLDSCIVCWDEPDDTGMTPVDVVNA